MEYSDYANIFSTDLAIELLENTNINKYAIELIEGKKLPYGPIYAINLVELETLKTYIKTYLKIEFIQPFKFPADIPYYLIRSLMAISAYILIIKVSTIL